MFRLDGKSALVTGASGGIGNAIAKALHAQGAEVVLSGTREAALQALADELGSRAHVVTANLGDAESVAALAKTAEEVASDGIDILINNAGVTKDGLMLRMKDEDWESVLNVNLTSGFRLSRALLRGMMKRRWGRIVGISSIVGATGNPGQANYAASKAGMVGFTKSLAQEVANRGITANIVAPGFIKTAMTDVLDEAQHEKLLAGVPAGRLGTPEDIAASVVYLASEEAAYVTGATIHVNGGMAML
ncbi:3-oxoacyl-[acyl-carrier-protein] reductase [Nisaea sediminum]|uniref:3-oxoacyl-[acyl-carrier-protein] reductase n=1 Tax=Nisaea sediminum TaxID=2775867 RepID=UPI001866CCA1|nr:3-oxoacyl-[acyl-carrier-protein] reductase [Nisaea sediminum]